MTRSSYDGPPNRWSPVRNPGCTRQLDVDWPPVAHMSADGGHGTNGVRIALLRPLVRACERRQEAFREAPTEQTNATIVEEYG